MPEASWTPSARADLDDVFDYIGRQQQSPLAAEGVVRRISEQCNEYATLCSAGHHLGSAAPELGDGIRTFTVMSWVVIFRRSDSGIEVLRLVHGSRDFPQWITRS